MTLPVFPLHGYRVRFAGPEIIHQLGLCAGGPYPGILSCGSYPKPFHRNPFSHLCGKKLREVSMSKNLFHNVFFTLKDPTPANIEKLVALCHKYLAKHPGVVYYSAGTLVSELRREVNDQDFHVALHVGFKDKAAHDLYQVAPDHLKFIEEGKPGWAKVRVFDSYVDGGNG